MSRQILSIATVLLCLVAVIVMKSRCGPAVDSMFKALDTASADGGATHRR